MSGRRLSASQAVCPGFTKPIPSLRDIHPIPGRHPALFASPAAGSSAPNDPFRALAAERLVLRGGCPTSSAGQRNPRTFGSVGRARNVWAADGRGERSGRLRVAGAVRCLGRGPEIGRGVAGRPRSSPADCAGPLRSGRRRDGAADSPPDASDEEVRRRLRVWLQDRPGAGQGDGVARPVAWPRTRRCTRPQTRCVGSSGIWSPSWASWPCRWSRGQRACGVARRPTRHPPIRCIPAGDVITTSPANLITAGSADGIA